MSFITATDAAALLDATPDTVREWARRGEIPAAKIGKEWRFIPEQLKEYIAKRAEENVRKCHSISVRRLPIGGASSQSVVERFANLPEPVTGTKQKSSKTRFAVVTGGKQN